MEDLCAVGGTVVRKHIFGGKGTYRRLDGLHVVCKVYFMAQVLGWFCYWLRFESERQASSRQAAEFAAIRDRFSMVHFVCSGSNPASSMVFSLSIDW